MVLPLVVGGAATPHCMTHAADAGAWVSGMGDDHPHRRLPICQCGHCAGGVRKLGVGLLRKAWINLDLVWAAALVVTSVATLAMAS
jgi:hypothetical protein